MTARPVVTAARIRSTSRLPSTTSLELPHLPVMARPDQDITHTSSNTSGSVVSSLSILSSGDYPDASDRRLLQHARDRRRMRDAVGGDPERVIAFRKARPKPRIAARLDGDGLDGFDAPVSEPNSSRRSSPDLPPRPGSMGDAQPLAASNIPRQWASKGRHRNDFLRRINSDGPIDRPRTPEQDPDIIYRRRTAFTGDSPRSDADFSATGAEAPLPTTEPDSPSRMRRSPLTESLRRRRTQRTSSLDLIQEILPDPDQHTDGARDGPSKRGLQSSRRTRLDENALKELNGNAASNDMPAVVAFKSNRTTAISAHDANAAGRDGGNRPGARRLGSRELLRQLARATSTTPSPSPHDVKHEKDMDRAQEVSPSKTGMPGNVPVDHRLPTPPEEEPLHNELKDRTSRPPRIKGFWSRADDGHVDGNTDSHISKAASSQDGLHSSPKTPQEEARKPRSAVEVILQDHEAQNAEDGFGDATIASLKGLIDDEATVDLSSLLPLDGETLDLINNVNVRVSKGEELRKEEQEQLNRMNEYLRAARSGVRHASKGLKRVGHQVEQAEGSMTVDHTQCVNCGHAGLTFSDIFNATSRSLRNQFATKSRKGQWALTWLGLISVVILVWSMLEFSLW